MSGIKSKAQKIDSEFERSQRDGFSIAQDIEKQRKLMEQQLAEREQEEKSWGANPEFGHTVFDLSSHREIVERPQQIAGVQQLIEEIRREVKEIKSHSDGLNAEIAQIEKATLQSLPDKPGIYHVRYLEILLSFLHGLKAKVGEAHTWLLAMQSKKAKRGSAFAVNSKKKGTQYSLSQELSTARTVQ